MTQAILMLNLSRLHAICRPPAPRARQYYIYLEKLVAVSGANFAVEVGTEHGGATLAIADGLPPRGKVLTFDLGECPPTLMDHPKVEFASHNLLDGLGGYGEQLAKADFVFLDVDPHDGLKEPLFIELFESILPVGKEVLWAFDDTNLNGPMQQWWVTLRKRPNWQLLDVGYEIGHSQSCMPGFGIGIYKKV